MKHKFALLFLASLLIFSTILNASENTEAKNTQSHGETHHETQMNLFDVSHWFGDNPNTTPPLLFLLINFAALIFIIYLILAKSMKERFANRKRDYEKALNEAIKMKEEALNTIENAKTKMAGLDEELVRMKKNMEETTAARRTAILESGKIKMEKMQKDAKAQVEQEVALFTESLRKDMADEITKKAASLLSSEMTLPDQNRLSDSYLEFIKNKNVFGEKVESKS